MRAESEGATGARARAKVMISKGREKGRERRDRWSEEVVLGVEDCVSWRRFGKLFFSSLFFFLFRGFSLASSFFLLTQAEKAALPLSR